MTLRDAYVLGIDVGFGIGEANKDRYSSIEFDSYYSECLETEVEHYRQFSPFEFVAKEFNDSDNPDKYWENYEEGVATGVSRAWIAV